MTSTPDSSTSYILSYDSENKMLSINIFAVKNCEVNNRIPYKVM